MERLKHPLFALLLVVACLVFTGCASTKYKVVSEPKRSAPMRLDLQAEAGGLSVSVDAIIVFEGPGSWKRKARWDEYIITLRNPDLAYAQLLSATLEDGLGHVLTWGVDPWSLEKASTSEMERFAKAGAKVVAGVGGATTWLAAVCLASAGGTGFVSAGAVAVSTATAIVIPVALVGHVIANREARQEVIAEFNRRRLPIPQTIPLQGELKGSLFFPICPAPRRLTLLCTVDGREQTLVVDLKPLAKLHIEEGSH